MRMIIVIGSMFLSVLFLREVSLLPDGKLHILFFDVGQGDSALIITPKGKQILIDGGPDFSVLEHLGTYMPFFDRTIDLLVLTHADADHTTAFPQILRRYDIGRILMTARIRSSGAYDSYMHALISRGIAVIVPHEDIDVVFSDDVILDVLWPTTTAQKSKTLSSNNLSIVLRVLYRGHAILLTGDIEQKAEHAILATGSDVRSDVLKVPHHGSRTSSSTGFLLAVDPWLAVISAGKDNRFGHPHADVTDRYRALGISQKTTANGVVSLMFE